MARIAGADGCKDGWICVIRDRKTGELEARVCTSAAELVSLADDLDVLAVDIPIGLPDAGHRPCDRLARDCLDKGRKSSVFPAPIRPALQATSREQASAITQAADGRKVSAQAWAIYAKIRDVDDELRKLSEPQRVVREVHPEVSFWAWNGSESLRFGKKTLEGMCARLGLVAGHFGEGAFRLVRDRWGRGKVGDDDILDAFAALWTAERIVEGRAVVLRGEALRDSTGLRMEIVY